MSTHLGGPIGEDTLAQTLSDALQTPVMVGHVLDSDLARVDGASLTGHPWSVIINEPVAQSTYPDIVPPDYTKQLPWLCQVIVDWGLEAMWSYTATTASVAEVVTRNYPLAEAGVRELAIHVIGYGPWGGSSPEVDLEALAHGPTEEDVAEMRKLMKRTGIDPTEE
ncbi:MAG: hypothetical protein QOG53_270 [Frankiales bacterium]|jgi:hypothetical protein|nr:hypothetical protein [Frankiales bacterium]